MRSLSVIVPTVVLTFSACSNAFQFMSKWKVPSMEEKLRKQEVEDQFGDKSKFMQFNIIKMKSERVIDNFIFFL